MFKDSACTQPCAAHTPAIRHLETHRSPRVRGMYAVQTQLAPWIRNGLVLIRDIIRSGIAIHVPHVPHPCAIDTQFDVQHIRNSIAGDDPPNHIGDLTAYLFNFSYAVRAPWHRRPVEQGHYLAWWRHEMETFSALLTICAGNSPVAPGEFPAQRPVTRSFDVFFDLRPNKRLSKQSGGWWFKTPSRPIQRHCNGKRSLSYL